MKREWNESEHRRVKRSEITRVERGRELKEWMNTHTQNCAALWMNEWMNTIASDIYGVGDEEVLLTWNSRLVNAKEEEKERFIEKYVDFMKSPSANERNLFIMSLKSTSHSRCIEPAEKRDSDLNSTRRIVSWVGGGSQHSVQLIHRGAWLLWLFFLSSRRGWKRAKFIECKKVLRMRSS